MLRKRKRKQTDQKLDIPSGRDSWSDGAGDVVCQNRRRCADGAVMVGIACLVSFVLAVIICRPKVNETRENTTTADAGRCILSFATAFGSFGYPVYRSRCR